ncbi:hypothetical protein GCM10009566_17560 [Streptomyces murinus]
MCAGPRCSRSYPRLSTDAQKPAVIHAGDMDVDRTRSLWRQIAAEIIRRIESGTYPPGSRVPSTLEIAQEFGVVNATAAKAMRQVREQGWTRGEVGLGTFVVAPLPSATGADQPAD